MTDLTKYMNLAIQKDRYEKILASWQKHAKVEGVSFTSWVTETLEDQLGRVPFLQKAYPHLKLIPAAVLDTYIIEDSKRGKMVKVTVKSGRIQCSEQDKDYVMFLVLHPLFKIRA